MDTEFEEQHQQSRPVPAGLIDFPAAGLPEYDGCFAIVLDDLFPRSTLSFILGQAQTLPWDVAKINSGTEAYTLPSYRNGQRIIYDSFELSTQIFEKIRPHLHAIEEIEEPTYISGGRPAVQKWRMVRMNERLRFLRYPKGGFFRMHCDGEYEDELSFRFAFVGINILTMSICIQENWTTDILYPATLPPVRPHRVQRELSASARWFDPFLERGERIRRC